jgi:hypothetical protein
MVLLVLVKPDDAALHDCSGAEVIDQGSVSARYRIACTTGTFEARRAGKNPRFRVKARRTAGGGSRSIRSFERS